jgi:hypothetical protein
MNYKTCGAAIEYTEEERFEIIRVREEAAAVWREENRRFREAELQRITLTRRQAAIVMLVQRGSPQSIESMEILARLSRIELQIERMREVVEAHQGQYIAPEECELHAYNVKRPSGTYAYMKLTAREAVFTPVLRRRWNKQLQQWEECRTVHTIHLSHEGEPRHIEAEAGIRRRNALNHLSTQLNNSINQLDTTLAAFISEMPNPFESRTRV